MIGIESVARAAPDGYTFLMTASTLSLNSVLYKKISYDPIKDFAPITIAANAPNVLIINPSVPGEDADRVHRAGQEAGRQADLRHARHRHLAAHEHGAAQEPGRRRPPAHPLSRHRARAHRRDQRPDHVHVLERATRPSRRSKPARCARSASPPPRAAAPCRISRRSRRPACPATKPCSGTASSRRQERRSRSSRRSMPRR